VAWFKIAGDDPAADATALLGGVLEEFMEVDAPYERFQGHQAKGRQRILDTLARYGLTYQRGGRVFGANAATPTRSLETLLRSRDIPALDLEVRRALENVERDPAATLTAASSLLESLFKVFIEDEGLPLPADKSVLPLWKVVKEALGLDPKLLEDDDLKKVLQGLASIVDGIACTRTHAGSAHGRGRQRYIAQPRHARLVAHAAHTLALFVLETWDAKKKNACKTPQCEQPSMPK
jgi:hypothetical protein